MWSADRAVNRPIAVIVTNWKTLLAVSLLVRMFMACSIGECRWRHSSAPLSRPDGKVSPFCQEKGFFAPLSGFPASRRQTRTTLPIRSESAGLRLRTAFKKVRAALDDIRYSGWIQIEGAVPPGAAMLDSYRKNLAFVRGVLT